MPFSAYISIASLLLSYYVLWQAHKASRCLDDLEKQIKHLELYVSYRESRR